MDDDDRRGDDHLEAVLEWGDGGGAAWVGDWLAERGLAAVEMLGGLLVTGSRAAFGDAFGVAGEEITRPGAVPVPAELAGEVASITLPGPKRIMAPDRPNS